MTAAETTPVTEAADLGIRAFQAASASRSNEWHGDKRWSLADWMTATMGELGEAANIVKKMNRHRDGIETDRDPSSMALASQLALELADTLAYLVLVADAANVDLAKATVAKFNQVSARQGWVHHLLPPLADGTADNPLVGTEVVISLDAYGPEGDEWWMAHLHLVDGGRVLLGTGYSSADEARDTVAIIRHALPGAPVRVVEEEE